MSEISQNIVDSIYNQPLISNSAIQLINVIGDKHHSSADTIQIIECDISLTAQILKIVNSASYGLNKPIETLAQAVIFLGEGELFRLAVQACAGSVLKNALPFYESEPGVLWAHSLKTGLAAKYLAPLVKESINAEIAFTGGILAEIGKLVIGQFLMTRQEEIYDFLNKDESFDNFLLLERKFLGTDHCQVGGELAIHWKLPEVLCQCIANHHSPRLAKDEFKSHAYIVHISDMVAMMSGKDNGIDCLTYPLDPDYVKYINIESSQLARIVLDVDKDFAKIKSSV